MIEKKNVLGHILHEKLHNNRGIILRWDFFLSIVQCTYAVLFSFPIVKVSINLCLLFAELSHHSDC